MSKKLIINAVEPREIRAAILGEDGEPENFFIERSEKKFQKGNVYWAKVTSVEPHLQAAFVELEKGQHGFLSLSDIMYPDGGVYLVTDKKSDKYLEFEKEQKELAEKKAQEALEKQKAKEETDRLEEEARAAIPKVVLAPSAGDLLLGDEDIQDEALSPILEVEESEKGDEQEVIEETDQVESEQAKGVQESSEQESQLESSEEGAEIEVKTQELTEEENQGEPEGQASENVGSEETGVDTIEVNEPEEVTEVTVEEQEDPEVETLMEVDDSEDEDSPVKYSQSHKRKRHTKKIEEILEVGQFLAVQIIKEGIGKKAPMVTTYLSLAGHYLVMTPGTEKGGISKQIRNQEERGRLREFIEKAKIPDHCGVIIRTAAENIVKKDLSADLKNVTNTWKNIQKIAKKSKEVTVLKREESLLTRVIRDYYNQEIDEIWVDDKKAFEDLQKLFKEGMKEQMSKLHHFEESKSIFDHHKLDQQLQALFRRKVIMPGGGSLVFDQCEAMLVIDINSGTFKEGTDDDDTAFKLNMLSCKEIARQVQMRDVGGIVMIDFVDMRRISQRTKVEKELERCFKGDKAKLNFMNIGPLGVMQMSRQRTKDSLRNSLYSTCQTCEGTGLVPSRKYSIMGILREIRENAGRFKNETLKVFVTPESATELLNRYRQDIDDIEEQFDVNLEILIKNDMRPGEFQMPQKNKKDRNKKNKDNKKQNSHESVQDSKPKKKKKKQGDKKKAEPGSTAYLEKLEKENPGGGPLGVLPQGQAQTENVEQDVQKEESPAKEGNNEGVLAPLVTLEDQKNAEVEAVDQKNKDRKQKKDKKNPKELKKNSKVDPEKVKEKSKSSKKKPSKPKKKEAPEKDLQKNEVSHDDPSQN